MYWVYLTSDFVRDPPAEEADDPVHGHQLGQAQAHPTKEVLAGEALDGGTIDPLAQPAALQHHHPSGEDGCLRDCGKWAHGHEHVSGLQELEVGLVVWVADSLPGLVDQFTVVESELIEGQRGAVSIGDEDIVRSLPVREDSDGHMSGNVGSHPPDELSLPPGGMVPPSPLELVVLGHLKLVVPVHGEALELGDPHVLRLHAEPAGGETAGD